jgi:peptidoglycan/LPS O-acetylase OafA/YrhL
MKVKRGIKIALLILSFAIVCLVSAATYSILVIEQTKFEYEILLLLAIILGGVLSMVYQIKTMKFYSLKTKNLELKGKLFWIGNLVFSISLFCFSLYFIYFIYISYANFEAGMQNSILITLAITILILLVGFFLALETSTLYKIILNQKERDYIDSIDDIKGHQEEDFNQF